MLLKRRRLVYSTLLKALYATALIFALVVVAALFFGLSLQDAYTAVTFEQLKIQWIVLTGSAACTSLIMNFFHKKKEPTICKWYLMYAGLHGCFLAVRALIILFAIDSLFVLLICEILMLVAWQALHALFILKITQLFDSSKALHGIGFYAHF